MHPFHHAANQPDTPAIIMAGSGETLSYAQLEAESNRIAHLLRGLGLVRGDTIAILMHNEIDFLPICWAAQRSGLVYVAMSTKLTADEAGYIAQDSGAKAIFCSPALADVAVAATPALLPAARFCTGGGAPGCTRLHDAIHNLPTTRIADESTGRDMLYSSGTTGRPKGVRGPLPEGPIDQVDALSGMVAALYQFAPGMKYLSPAPLYHAAPLRYCMSVHKFGGTVVVMEKFDPEAYLALVEKHHITHSQLVPTMFVRMLKLPE
uniref:AMP-binding protein n=1 Tax=Sandarakinorhabdus sp. TaxID=1916663 RepID=UPI0028AFA26D